MRNAIGLACLATMLIGGIWPILAPFQRAEPFPTTAQQSRSDHAALQCFADGVLHHTEPRSRIRFVLPQSELDGGLVNHRLRYIVPGRQILIEGEADYVATWFGVRTGFSRSSRPAEAGPHTEADPRTVWRGCGGELSRR